jgi:hypothetical protein
VRWNTSLTRIHPYGLVTSIGAQKPSSRRRASLCLPQSDASFKDDFIEGKERGMIDIFETLIELIGDTIHGAFSLILGRDQSDEGEKSVDAQHCA